MDLIPCHRMDYGLTSEALSMSLEWPQTYFKHQSRTVEIQLASEDTMVEFHANDRWVCHLNGSKLSSVKTSWRTAWRVPTTPPHLIPAL